MRKRLCVALVASVLLSCTASKPPPPQPPPPSEPRTFPLAPPAPGGAPATDAPAAVVPAPGMPPPGTYRIDSSQSELRLLVYRAGALANLGHNHVILNRSVNGSITVAPTMSASSFALSAAVTAFMVDDSQARSEEGEDFPGDIADDTKLKTWNNMTGPDVLNAVQYPVISVRSVRLETLQTVPTATLLVSVVGHDSTLVLPFQLHKEAYGLSATASFELRQSALGMTPFGIMLGALTVRDAMQVKLKIIAVYEAPR